jgi:hypothetical protein
LNGSHAFSFIAVKAAAFKDLPELFLSCLKTIFSSKGSIISEFAKVLLKSGDELLQISCIHLFGEMSLKKAILVNSADSIELLVLEEYQSREKTAAANLKQPSLISSLQSKISSTLRAEAPVFKTATQIALEKGMALGKACRANLSPKFHDVHDFLDRHLWRRRFICQLKSKLNDAKIRLKEMKPRDLYLRTVEKLLYRSKAITNRNDVNIEIFTDSIHPVIVELISIRSKITKVIGMVCIMNLHIYNIMIILNLLNFTCF